jgi:flagellar hook-associated protein 1
MRSTFMGLETARRGMFTQQGALQTTGHNIANASTPGYTRQRVNFTQTEPYPGAGLNMPQLPGQVGTGVEAGSVQRIRESFLDVQYRGENNKLGYWEARAESYTKMEEIMNEPSDSGLSTTMDQFWQSLQDLAVNPSNPGARSVVRQRAIAVTETFSYLSSSLNGIRADLKNEISVSEKEINSLSEQINNINKQIAGVEPHGMLPNDLYDERDRLIDQLSSLVNIKVDYTMSGGKPSPIAEGSVNITLLNDKGGSIGQLVNSTGFNKLTVNFDGTDASVKTIQLGNTQMNFQQFTSSGKLKSLVESYGYDSGNNQLTGVYPNMIDELDNMAYMFAYQFNLQHMDGKTPNQINATTEAEKNAATPEFFSDSKNGSIIEENKKGMASRLTVSESIMNSLDNIATASKDNPTLGDATNIKALADIINKPFKYGNDTESSFRNYYEVLVGGMAVDSQEAARLSVNSGSLRQAVDERRLSVSSVSLDEEMTNMIQFQHAYNASARMISLQDELLDKIINGMGTGGR